MGIIMGKTTIKERVSAAALALALASPFAVQQPASAFQTVQRDSASDHSTQSQDDRGNGGQRNDSPRTVNPQPDRGNSNNGQRDTQPRVFNAPRGDNNTYRNYPQQGNPQHYDNAPHYNIPRYTQPRPYTSPNYDYNNNNSQRYTQPRPRTLPSHNYNNNAQNYQNNQHRGQGNDYGNRNRGGYENRDRDFRGSEYRRGVFDGRGHRYRYGWDRRFWYSEWPFVVIVGLDIATRLNREVLSLGPDFDNQYFVVSGSRNYDQCVMGVALYDQNDNFMASIFPGDLYAPEYAQFGDQIVAAGLNNPNVQQQLADDLCNGGYPTFR